MTDFIPKEKLTAYHRWEVAAFDEARKAAENSIAPPEETLTAAQESAPEALPDEESSATSQEAAVEAPLENEALAESAADTDAIATTTPGDGEAVPAIALPTAADIERMHAEAHEQGYAAGFTEGQAAGHAEGLTKANEIATRINTVLNGLQASISALDQQVADQLLATAVEIAGQVLRQSLRIKPELLLPVVREAVNALHPLSGHPLLCVHPDDAELIRSHLGEQLTHKNWRIVEDPDLTPGGCRVEHGASEVDATLETRWRRVIESMGITEEWLNGKP